MLRPQAVLLIWMTVLAGQSLADYCADCNRGAVKEALGLSHVSDEKVGKYFQDIPTCFNYCVSADPQRRNRVTTTTTTQAPTTTTPSFFGFLNRFGSPGRFGGRRKRQLPEYQAKCLAWELQESAEDHLFKCMNDETPLVSTKLEAFTDPTTTTTTPGPVPAVKTGPLDIFSILNPGAASSAGQPGGLDFFSSFLGGQAGSNPLTDLFGGGGGGGNFLSGLTGGINPTSFVPKAPAAGGSDLFGGLLGGWGGGGGGAENIFSKFVGRKKRATNQNSAFHQMMMLAYTNELVDELCPNSRSTVAQCITYVSEDNIQMEYLNPAFTREVYCDNRLRNQCLYCRHKRAADPELESKRKFCTCYDKMRHIIQNRCGTIENVQECENLKNGITSSGAANSGNSGNTRITNTSGNSGNTGTSANSGNSGSSSSSRGSTGSSFGSGSSGNREEYSHLAKDDVCSREYVMPTVHDILG